MNSNRRGCWVEGRQGEVGGVMSEWHCTGYVIKYLVDACNKCSVLDALYAVVLVFALVNCS